MIVKLPTEHHLECLSLKGGCRGSSEFTLVRMSNCWKSHVKAHMLLILVYTCQNATLLEISCHGSNSSKHYKRVGYRMNVMQRSACLVMNPITVYIYVFLFIGMPVGQASDTKATLSYSFNWLFST